MANPIYLSAMTLGILGVLFTLVGFSTSYWASINFFGIKYNVGLLLKCNPLGQCVTNNGDGT